MDSIIMKFLLIHSQDGKRIRLFAQFLTTVVPQTERMNLAGLKDRHKDNKIASFLLGRNRNGLANGRVSNPLREILRSIRSVELVDIKYDFGMVDPVSAVFILRFQDPYFGRFISSQQNPWLLLIPPAVTQINGGCMPWSQSTASSSWKTWIGTDVVEKNVGCPILRKDVPTLRLFHGKDASGYLAGKRQRSVGLMICAQNVDTMVSIQIYQFTRKGFSLTAMRRQKGDTYVSE